MPSTAAGIESIATNAQFITFPVTDGDISRRPENTRPPPASAREVNWHRTMSMDERYACRWKNLIGKGIAKMLDKPDKDKYCLKGFPEGYCMFDHNKGPISNIRHDLYLHGSKTVLRFRSPAEFIPHGYWLLTDPTLNTKNCGCKYCGGGGKKTQTEISEALGLPTNRGPTSVTGHKSLRTGGLRTGRISGPMATSDGSWVPPSKRQSPKIDPVWNLTSLNLELAADSGRISDLRSRRRFRQGELVWCAWNTRATVEGREAVHGPTLWPAVVSDHGLETSITQRSCASKLTECDSVLQRRVYYVRRLGSPSIEACAEYDCMLHEDEILPWHAHRMVSSSSPSSSSSSKSTGRGSPEPSPFALKVADHLVKFWAVCDRLPIKVPVAPSLAHPARTQTDDPSDTGSATSSALPSGSRLDAIDMQSPSARSTPSLHMPFHVDSTPPQRSPARLMPPSPARSRISSSITATASSSKNALTESLLPQRVYNTRGPQPPKDATATETRYQGLWYGAERIWVGDLVRLSPEREAFSASLRLTLKLDKSTVAQRRITPSPGATSRGVLIRVDRIFARIGDAGTKECAVAGPLYEIAPKEWATSVAAASAPRRSPMEEHFYPWDITDSPPPGQNKRQLNHMQGVDLTSFPLPPAPSGYALRPLLPSGSELPVPASYIAGRYYPDLLQWPLLARNASHSHDTVSSLSRSTSTNAQLQSLCALAPGRFNHAVCVDVKLANRARMLEEAVLMAKAELSGESRGSERERLVRMEID